MAPRSKLSWTRPRQWLPPLRRVLATASRRHLNTHTLGALSLTFPSNKKGPKAATAAKPTTNGAGTRDDTRGRGRGARRGRNAGRAKPKTADELDAEMVDYFDTNAANGTAQGTDAAATNGAVQPVANGADDLGMDEISVGLSTHDLQVHD